MAQEQTKRGRGRPVGSGEAKLMEMQRILDYIKSYTKAPPHIPPTLVEIAIGIGRKAGDKGNIQPMVKALIREGFLEQHGRYRSLVLAKKPPRRYFYKPNGID